MIIESPCPICSSPQKKILQSDLVDVEAHTPGRYAIARCQPCGFIYLSRRPSADSLLDCYPESYYTLLAARRSLLTQKLYQPRYQFRKRRMEKVYQGIPPSLLEIGYGDGAFLAYLKSEWKDQCRLSGIDFKPPNPPQRLTGIDLFAGDFLQFQFQTTYDVVVLYSVLEHLPNPLEALRRLRQILKPKGLLVLEVPNWNSLFRLVFPRHWSGLQIPRHQSFFTRSSLTTLLEKAGFKPKKLNRIFDPGDLSVSFCNWLSDRFKLQTPPRQSWFFLPATLASSPFVFLQCLLFRNSGESETMAQRTE